MTGFLSMTAFAGALAIGQGVVAGGATAASVGSLQPMSQQIRPCYGVGNGSMVLVSVRQLQSNEGNVRVQVYSNNPDEFLEKGKRLVRVDVPTQRRGLKICVPLPGPGKYALVVIHDRNANGIPDFMTEGFGFSNNPKLMLAPPDHAEAVFVANGGVVKMSVSMFYLIDVEQKEHRTRRRR